MTWQTAKLGELARVRTGKLDANAADENGLYPFFTCAVEPLSINTPAFDCKAILVAGNGDLNVKYYEGKFNAYQRTYVIESLDEKILLPRYLYLFLNEYVNELRALAIGGVIKYIKLANLTDALIPLPPLAEQQRITEILDKAELVKRKRKLVIEKLDALAESIFLEMFGNPLSISGSIGKRVNFEDMVNRITYGFTSPMKHMKSGIPILTAKNIKNGYIDFQNIHFADKAQFDELTSKSKPVVGDILVTKDGTIGRTALVETEQNICINQSVALIQPKHDLVLSRYIVGYLSLNSVQKIMKNMAKGNALPHLQITELAKLPIPLPSLVNQEKYVLHIDLIKKQKLHIINSYENINNLSASLADRLLIQGLSS